MGRHAYVKGADSQSFNLLQRRYESPSYEAATSVSSRWTSRISDNGHSGSLLEDEIQHSTHTYLDRLIQEADKGHTGHYSNIDELLDCDCR